MATKQRIEKQADIFARAIHEGKTQRTAFKESHPESKSSEKGMDEMACKWAKSAKVMTRLAQLEAQAAERAIANTDAIQAELTNIALNDDENTGARLKAFDQLARMQGAYLDRTEHSGKIGVDIERARAEAWDALNA